MKLVDVDLLIADFTLLKLLLLHFFFLLEVALGLQVAVRAHAAETIVLGDVAGGVRASIVVEEGVGVRGFRAESRRGY